MKLRDQPGADEDHDGAQHERAQDAEHQDALLVLGRHREVREHQQEHEDVVDRQRLLDQVTRHELERLGIRDRVALEPAEVPPEPADEQQRDRDPDQRPDGRLFHRHLVRALPLHRKEVDRQCEQHEGDEQGPQQRGAGRHHRGGGLWCGSVGRVSRCGCCNGRFAGGPGSDPFAGRIVPMSRFDLYHESNCG